MREAGRLTSTRTDIAPVLAEDEIYMTLCARNNELYFTIPKAGPLWARRIDHFKQGMFCHSSVFD